MPLFGPRGVTEGRALRRALAGQIGVWNGIYDFGMLFLGHRLVGFEPPPHPQSQSAVDVPGGLRLRSNRVKAAATRTAAQVLRRALWAAAVNALVCQAQPAPAPAPSASEAQVMSLLNSSVDWYHAVKASDAWLVQANDDFYKSSQDLLANQALTNSFAYAQAMVAVIGVD